MESKKVCYSEAAYGLGLIILAMGTALMEKANLGMSMVVAPAYLLHLKVQPHWSAFTFGMAEYVFQAFLLVVLCIVLKRGKLSYLFSFVTAVLYGLMLDASMSVVSLLPCSGMVGRLVFYGAGLVLGSVGVALLFHTYIAPEAYELFVKELSVTHGWPIEKVKTVYDCVSCLVGVGMSFAFFGFGHFEGVKLGTIVCALVNGWLIGRISHGLENRFVFRDAWNLRKLFET